MSTIILSVICNVGEEIDFRPLLVRACTTCALICTRPWLHTVENMANY